MRRGLEVHVSTDLVSRPYVEMTAAVMAAFGATVDLGSLDRGRVEVAPTGYRSPDRYVVEADASAASYFLAAAAIAGGRVRVDGVGAASLQGDVAFADVLERMGATVTRAPDHLVVESDGHLRGVEVDMGDISDTAQTLAAVAVFAEGPTRVRGIGFIRGKETDRIAGVVTELRRLGIEAHEDADGFTVVPGTVQPATVATYDDHRMAMSFALVGLRATGVRIADPGCVAKTYPDYWADLASVAGPVGGPAVAGS
jgi:3-phosphoshikimate 1-carboxyvinyltransferase